MGKFLIQRSPFHREHTLVITPDVVEYDMGNGNEKGMVRIKKAEILDVKHTTEAIAWGGASLGRKFCIDIKCTNNSTLSVVFNSYFSLKPEYIRTYFKILRNLWDYFLRDLAEHKRERFAAGETLVFGKVKVTPQGIEIPMHGLTINWSDLVLVEERSFFVLSNQYAPHQSIRVPFNEWGSEVLCALVSTILKRASVETPARVRDLV